jgi:DNA-binding protein HU-beta
MSERDEGYLPWIAANPEVFQFDAMDVLVAAVRATRASWRSRRPVRHERFNSVRAYELHYADSTDREGVPLPLTQTQLATAVADRAEITTAEAKRVLGALEEIVLEELGTAQKVRVGGLVQLTVRVKPAQKKRKGRNPATGEEIMIAAKPASVDVRARPLAKAKAALPSVQKARRRLAA